MSEETDGSSIEVATLAGGCFWCTEAVFQKIRGVEHVESGYTGGDTEHPTYERVSMGTTGHAEAVQVHFDPGVVSLRDILKVFFATHDPTTPNRQGADVGTQYRSAIFYGSPEQREVAEGLIAELDAQGLFDAPIVTEVAALEEFWAAERHHQDYYRENPKQGYCRVVIDPKMAKLRAEYADLLTAD